MIAVILAFLGQAQDGSGLGSLSARLDAGHDDTWGFAVGGLALLMVQYCSGGKWGLLLRRPLEAMSRTLPLVFVYWVVIAIFMKQLYLWAQYTTSDATRPRRSSGTDHRDPGALPQLQAAHAESRLRFSWVSLLCFAIWGFYTWRLNRWR